MSRSSITMRWLGLTAMLAALTALAWVAFAPGSADAQDPAEAELSVAVSDFDELQPQRTAAVGIDVGTSGLAALTIDLIYDESKISVLSCSVAEAGACHDRGGIVTLAVFNLSGIDSNDQILTIDFEPVAGATGTTELTTSVTTAAGFLGDPIGDVSASSIEFDVAISPDSLGSLTGDVVFDATGAGVFAASVCAAPIDQLEAVSCVSTNGWGAWRIDGLPAGAYLVTITDPDGTYGAVDIETVVVAQEITTGLDAALSDETVIDDSLLEEQPDADVDAAEAAADKAARDAAIEIGIRDAINYDASIVGKVRMSGSRTGLEAVQVCATQPLVLHQSCATTDADGNFVLDGLSAGNYAVSVVDPLGRIAEPRPKLVGLVTDQTVRRVSIVVVDA